MKIRVVAFFLFINAFSVYGQTSRVLSLDEAINEAALQIQNSLNQGSGIIVYQFQSQNTKLSDYVLRELFTLLDQSRKFKVMSRASREVSEAEVGHQFSRVERISDQSLASLTAEIGAQASITGDLVDVGSVYRFYINVIEVGTTAGAGSSYAVDIPKNDRRIAALIKREPNIGEKIGFGALNMVLGLGSYIEGDIFGGLTLTGGYVLAVGLIVVEVLALDWDSPMVGVPITSGIIVAGVTMAYGFARPLIYNHSKRLAYVIDNTQPQIILTSDSYIGKNNFGFQLSYTIKF